MNKYSIRFITALFFSSVLLVLGVHILHAIYRIPIPSFYLEIIIYFFCSALFSFYKLNTPKRNEPLGFVQLLMASIVLKIIIGCVLIYILFRLDPNGANSNALFFVISYLLFTACEVTVLTIKKNKE